MKKKSAKQIVQNVEKVLSKKFIYEKRKYSVEWIIKRLEEKGVWK